MTKKEELEQKITKAQGAYYNDDTSIISDIEYDSLIDELKEIDPYNKLITAIGAKVPKGTKWKKVRHEVSMQSLNKVKNPEEFHQWYSDCGKGKVLISDKLDGISLDLKYENGKLVQGATRGSGDEGENITRNVQKMKGVVQEIKDFTGHIRGEIVLQHSDCKHFPDIANPRNAASGIAKRIDGVGVQHLSVKVYKVEGQDFATEFDAFTWLQNKGFKTPNFSLVNNEKEVIDYWNKYMNETRVTLDYDIDGLVVAINDCTNQYALGQKNNRPQGAVAFKFEAYAVETTLLDVVWQVGDTGRITPVAILEPVDIGGVQVKKASLHNSSYVRKLDLYTGCKVLVSRRNDVIPYIERKIS